MSASTNGGVRMTIKMKELEAVKALARQYERLTFTAAVDNDFFDVWADYENAMKQLLDTLHECGRFDWKSMSNAYKIGPGDFLMRLHEANASRGKRWHPSGIVSWSLSDWFTALAGEVGELGNVIKKLNRERDGLKGNKETHAELLQAMGKEVADVFIYLELFCQVANIDLVKATVDKFNEVSERNGFPERL